MIAVAAGTRVNSVFGLLFASFITWWGAMLLFRAFRYLRNGRAEYWADPGCLGAGERGKTPFAFWLIVLLYACFGLALTTVGVGTFVWLLLG
jgi:hypothetical protein